MGRISRKLYAVILLAGCIFLMSCDNSSEGLHNGTTDNSVATDQNSIEGQNGEAWQLIEHLEDESVSVWGYQASDQFPYGYNVGKIEDEVVGTAILITPGTSIVVEETFESPVFLSIDYILHPWVAADSDGAVLSVSVENGGNIDSYMFNATDAFQNEVITIDQSSDNDIRITFSVQNKPGGDDICDWLILKNVIVDNSMPPVHKIFNEDGYVRSATYFSDEWPLNFWNSEMDDLDQDMKQIRNDGFDSIILVIPWREFQPELDPIIYNEYAFDKLERVMQAAEQNNLNVYARIGYTWDFYNDENENIVDRFCRLLGEDSVKDAWCSYCEKMYETLSAHSCFREAFLTWEDFWNTLGVCDEIFETARREKADYIGYQTWVEDNFALSEYNESFGTKYKSYTAIPVPQRTEPAMAAMYSFYDDFLIELLEMSQRYFPNLSMEVRLDWDVIYTPDGAQDYYKHTKTFECGKSYFTATMYGIPMGFQNVGERVSYQEAMEKTEYMLKMLKSQNGDKPVYVEQFIFADNTPKFINNAQIKEEEVNEYLENVAPILLDNSEGYGIWTYRNYCSNMLYNSQFALGEEGWKIRGDVAFKESDGSMACLLRQGASISQSVDKVRNHFDSEEYFVSFDVVEVELPGELTISVGTKSQTIELNESGKICVAFSGVGSFDIKVMSRDCTVKIDNIKLYSQVQQGFLYDENNEELQCIEGIRALNEQLCVY